ncbi:MAG TPA: hypothetical protein VFR17_03140 [Mycobacterium sp.]|nr:hypothetical protein [Mycobacterium sp.]
MTARATRWAGPGYALALTCAVLAPLLRPGYLLLRDAVSTPRSYLSDAALGLGESAPRAVPQDFAVATASHLLDGGIVVKALLAAGLWLAGCGAARLVSTVLPQAGLAGQFTAVTVAIWNPYVAERLLQGHWSLLVGYGCLPWVAATMLTLRTGSMLRGRAGRKALLPLVFWIALAGLTPTGLLLAAAVALACALATGTGWPRRLCAGVTSAVAAAVALPWLAASALGSSAVPGAPFAAEGVAAFSARAEPGLGTLASLAGLGGLWNADAVPPSRTTLFALPATLVLLGVVALGLPVVLRRRSAAPLLVLAAGSILVSAAMSTGPGLDVLRTLTDGASGFGVLRDGQKWVALAVPGYALAGAGAVVNLRRWLRPAAAALACCAALILALPDLTWGVLGRVESQRYPAGWPEVAAAINAEPRTVAELPAGDMRRFAWTGTAPVLDPLPRWVRADVLTTGDLIVSGRTVPGEGSRARAVQTLLLSGADPAELAGAGVGWVVVESGSDGEMGSAAKTLVRLTAAHRDADLSLYRAGGDTPGASAGRRRLAVAAHLVWLGLLAAGGAGMAVSGRRGRPVGQSAPSTAST